MDRQQILAVLDRFQVGQLTAPHWMSYREQIADALMEGGGDDSAQLGLVSQSHEGRQVLGTCSPERRITFCLKRQWCRMADGHGGACEP